MPTDDENEELDDGTAGGAIRWSPDNVITPPAASAAPKDGPVSWENLFGGSEPATAAEAQPDSSQQSAQSTGPESQSDRLFSRGPSHQPAPKQELDNNPFTTPALEAELSSAPVFRPETLPSQTATPTQAPAFSQASAPAPTQAPAPATPRPPAPAPALSQPERRPTQTAAPSPTPTYTQAPVQALGFNPAPQFSNNSDKETVDASGKITSEYQPVHQYFSADDIEEEIVRERGPAEPPMRVAQPLDVEGGRQAQSASPFAQVIASYGQAPTEATQPRPQVPAAQAPYAQDPRSQSSARMPSVASPSAGAKDDQDDQGPDLSSVPEIETARIWEQRTSKEILMGILKAKKAEYAVALFASTDGAVQGEMLVVKSVVIHGAKLVEPDLSGYEALKVMLAIPHGTYTLLDVTDYVESAQQLEQGLSVRITPLANALPNLPDSVDELMGASQISRIRSKGPVDLEAAVAPPKPPKPLTIGERLPSTKMMVLIAFTILALIMMLVVLYVRR